MTTDSYQRQPIPSNQELIDKLEKIEASMYAFKEEMFSMLKAIDTRLSLLSSHPHPMPVQERRPLVPVNHGTIATTAAANIVEARLSLNSSVQDNNENDHGNAIQNVLANPKITGPVHLGMELAKVMYTEQEMATSTVTGRKVNGVSRPQLNAAKLASIDSLVRQKLCVNMTEVEFACIKSSIREAIASRCKYLRMKFNSTYQL